MRRYPQIRQVVDESCPGLLTQRPVADDLVADWRAVAVAVDGPEARPAPASLTADSTTPTGIYSDASVGEPPAAATAAGTGASDDLEGPVSVATDGSPALPRNAHASEKRH